MLEKIKSYLLLLTGLLGGVLYLIIRKRDSDINQLQSENSSLKVEKELVHVSKEADKKTSDYKSDKLDYDNWKSSRKPPKS